MSEKSTALKKFPTIGVCGLDCGLCPRYYTDGPSRCPGCGGTNFFNKHPSCSFITCCVKRKGLEVCAECDEYPCGKFKTAEEYGKVPESSSYPPYKRVLSNSSFIQDHGIEKFMAIQKRRVAILEAMLQDFNDGRSRSSFCRACAMLEVNDLESALNEAATECKTKMISYNEVKSRSKILKRILEQIAFKAQHV